ncbi:MAG: hypothetical protein MK089_04130, partial [Phycisphaerales bacterium]|nr:hypothetical protein [Phycisphaerales bacterium]
VLKALGTGLSGGITWQDVDVHRSGNGAPMLKMHGVAAEKADELGLQIWRLSMSHAGGMAMASVVAMGAASSDS